MKTAGYVRRCATRFRVSCLDSLTLSDFITHIKKGTQFKQVARFLLSGKVNYLGKKRTEKRVMKALMEHVFSYESIEEEIIDVKPEKEKEAHLTIRIKDSEILRGEIFLHDLSPFLNEQHITIEDLLTILYLDFIKQIKEHGNSMIVQKTSCFT
ncbi:hypothetical protein [Peribacillus loiseleuriae]|uniref:Uncharacterized protein n=1 Tax=Peribacillus loiseleuriae TaxID=1679170 RepID=A0A0K9G8M5_9BACI|nr:hypothetical protein [Peribacillus loiseleuriae]KMY42771.1 hypothetical protein AC625_24260 [Peribacillus loiseleuriae]